MALSQLQCLDDGNINYRTNESKPEFFYSEPQRLALETLLAHGTQAFNEMLIKENLREFLSEMDIEQILRSVRDFLPEGMSTEGQDEAGQDEGEGAESESEGEGAGESEGRESESEGESEGGKSASKGEGGESEGGVNASEGEGGESETEGEGTGESEGRESEKEAEGDGESESEAESESEGEGDGENESKGERDGKQANQEPEKKPLSLHYWPNISDISRPCLDLGWPDPATYRGVTRANVYTQPPVEGSMHIKEMVRRMISHAQKVIAVVMDLFTDIDIFKDLLDASSKRKVPVYIIHDELNIKYFLKMCESSGMHMGMLKNLRVCSINGTEFNTRSGKTIVGRQLQKFLLIDGDRAACGSYSFTWTASRLDRNIITVLSGQAVETFDKEFRELLHFSKAVDMHKLNLAPDTTEPKPVQQMPVLTAEQSAVIARKLINPKYALVRVNDTNPGSASSDGKKQPNGPNKAEKAAIVAEPYDEGLIIHPALLNMPKVDLFVYLPTYVEVPQNESHQQNGFLNMKERNHKLCQHDTVDMLARVGPDSSSREMAQRKQATRKNPDLIQIQALNVKEDPFQNHTQTNGNNRGTENKPGVDLSTTNRIKTPKVKQKPNANVGKQEPKLIETTAITSTQHKDNYVNETLSDSTESVERLQVGLNAPVYRLHVDKQATNILEKAQSKEKEVFTLATDEIEVVTESNEAEPDQETPPEEVDLICLEDDCPSNPSTNYTLDWFTDCSSLHEPSIASSDSDDFYDYDYVDSTVRRTAPRLAINEADDELTVREVTNFVSRGTFERPLNNYKQRSYSVNDVREGKSTGSKDVNAFFQERADLRKKALDKLKVTLAINYHNKFQRNRYAMPSKLAANLPKSTVNTQSFHSYQSVSRSLNLNKSRRPMPKPMGLPISRLLHKNYQKVIPHSSVLQINEQQGLASVDMTAGVGMTKSKLYSNCVPHRRISTDPDMSSSHTSTPLGLSISKLGLHKNLMVKLPVSKVAQSSESTSKGLTN
ncbi:protein FAM83G-like [Heterodontus francisci]|uniref:protein FAM83G-like n=1 Tax=Heterodontus francisci TaxID=7792 RepID=UPI00355C2A8F